MPKLKVRATFSFKSDRMHTVLLNEVYVDGEVFRDHTWVEYHDDMDEFGTGDIITFNANYHIFMGLDMNNNYVEKRGLKDIRNIQKMRP